MHNPDLVPRSSLSSTRKKAFSKGEIEHHVEEENGEETATESELGDADATSLLIRQTPGKTIELPDLRSPRVMAISNLLKLSPG